MLSINCNWRVGDAFADRPEGEKFSSLDRVYACRGEEVTRDPISHVKRVTFQGKRYYVKIYDAAGKRLRRYVGRSRVRAEWENLMVFRGLGIATPEIVAFGEERRYGLYRRGALVTLEVANTMDLESHARKCPEVLKDKQWVTAVLDQVAENTRKMHDAGFAHSDLNWRNILVSTQGAPAVYFIDCPAGRFWPWPFLRRRTIRDLAHLDKVGRELLSNTQRLRFYLAYKQQERLSKRDKHEIPMILSLHDKHRERKQQRLEEWQRRRAQKLARERSGKSTTGEGSSDKGHRARGAG